MSSFTSTISNFEELPDEILLLICRYLSSTDILLSFYGLNSRLSQTISGFCQHVVLAQIPFAKFSYICTSILPQIGVNIYSLVVSNDWKGVLSKMFLNYFGEKMSLTFPCLRRLILPTYRISSLMSFLDCLHNLSELFEIKIMSLYEMGDRSMEPEKLLQRIFTANNNRLTSILFDDDSLSYSYKNKIDMNYPHIKKLIIELKTVTDLHRLLTALPQLKFLDVNISDEYFNFAEETQVSPISSLKYFRLRSYIHSWNLDELVLILKRIPNVQELIFEISTDEDIRLINGQDMFSHLSSLSLTKFNYFLRFDHPPSFDEKNILSSWQQFNQEFICIKSDDDDTLVLYTLPFDISYLYLRYPLAKNKIFIDNYSSQVRFLTLYDVSKRIAETFSIINKCYRVQRLVLRVDEDIEPQSFQPIQLCKLPYLTFFVALEKSSVNTDDFKKLLEVAPNLYHLAINYEFIKPFFDSESMCYLLKDRITHLLIGISLTTSLESVTDSISRLSSIFPSLKHLYFHTESNIKPVKSLILTVFKHLCQWNFLVSFGVANITLDSEILTKDIREWVIENSLLNDKDSFIADYSDNTFRLWL